MNNWKWESQNCCNNCLNVFPIRLGSNVSVICDCPVCGKQYKEFDGPIVSKHMQWVSTSKWYHFFGGRGYWIDRQGNEYHKIWGEDQRG